MRPSLRRLLDHPIDYAGLFPPAQHEMAVAVSEYLEVTTGSENWIVDKFVCPASRLSELIAELGDDAAGQLPVTVVGSQNPEGAMAAAKADAEAMVRARATGVLELQSYEAKVPQGAGLEAAVSAYKRLPKMAEDDAIEMYLEVGWGEGAVDAMHDAASLFEEAGFKARVGGSTADAFPTTEQFAAFISECAALECPFKYTAGLHEPVRYYDEHLGTYRHGFLNAILAGALAATQDLNRREIEAILELDDPSKMHFGVDDIRVGDHWLEAEHIDEFWRVFGGFGSCSVQEPLDGLRRLGLLEEVGA